MGRVRDEPARSRTPTSAKVQEKWLADLQAFVGKYPKSADAAEALLQLGMYQEFVGKTEEATKWYQQLVTQLSQRGAGGQGERRAAPARLGRQADAAAAATTCKARTVDSWPTYRAQGRADSLLGDVV